MRPHNILKLQNVLLMEVLYLPSLQLVAAVVSVHLLSFQVVN